MLAYQASNPSKTAAIANTNNLSLPLRGVRESLILRYEKQDDPSLLPADIAAAAKIDPPFYTVDFDFRLAPADSG